MEAKPLCTSSDTLADKQIDACNYAKVIASKNKQVVSSNSSLIGEVYPAAK